MTTTGTLVRLLGYARPWLGLIGLALLLSAAYSGSRYLRVYLIKPLLDEVVVPGVVISETTQQRWLPELGAPDPSVGTAAKGIAPPGLTRGTAPIEEIRGRFASIVMAACGLIVVLPCLLFARSTLEEWVLGRIHISIKQDVCAHLLALPLRYHRDQRRGDIVSRTLEDVDSAQGALRLVFGTVLVSALSICMGIAFLFALSPPLAMASLLLAPILFGVISLFGRRIRKTARRRQEKIADVTQRLVEILSGIKVIKAFRAEENENAAFRRETDHLFRRSMRVVRNRVAARSIVEMFNSAVGIGVIVAGTWIVARGWWDLTPGDFAAFAAILVTAYKPVKDLARGFVRLMDAQPSAVRFFEMLDEPAESPDPADAVEIRGAPSTISIRNVSFAYDDVSVLSNVSLDVSAGEVLAIVGPSGAGKTTLVDLLLRFDDPKSGRIDIDGIDLRGIRRDSWLEQIAVVGQDPFLFDGTLRENLAYARPDASEGQVLAAARAARVDEFADQLPQGYDTPVGAMGVRLSGGQRQRVTIARALLKDPAILVFDEATSALDSKSERVVQDAIEGLFGDRRTVFVIAHRLSTVRRADRIVVLEHGRITQIGSHEELVAKEGLYRELAALQGDADPHITTF